MNALKKMMGKDEKSDAASSVSGSGAMSGLGSAPFLVQLKSQCIKQSHTTQPAHSTAEVDGHMFFLRTCAWRARGLG